MKFHVSTEQISITHEGTTQAVEFGDLSSPLEVLTYAQVLMTQQQRLAFVQLAEEMANLAQVVGKLGVGVSNQPDVEKMFDVAFGKLETLLGGVAKK